MKIEAYARLQASTKVCGCVTAACEHVTALTEKQKKLDIDGDGKIDGEDLKKVRKGEIAEATALTAAGPMDAARMAFHFSRNGMDVKTEKGSDDGAVFSVNMMQGLFKAKFSLKVSGGKILVTTLSPNGFDLQPSLMQFLKMQNTSDAKLSDADLVSSMAQSKWKASLDKLIEDTTKFMDLYRSTFYTRFTEALYDMEKELKSGGKK